MRRLLGILFLVITAGAFLFIRSARADKVAVVEDGRQVKFDYTLTVDGNMVDTTERKEPFQYTHGEGRILPALASQLKGMRVGDKKEITLSPKDGYGEVNQDAFKEIRRTLVKGDREPKVGDMLRVKTTDGNMIAARVQEIKKDTMVVDFNHPLAGKTLHFAVKIVDIK